MYNGSELNNQLFIPLKRTNLVRCKVYMQQRKGKFLPNISDFGTFHQDCVYAHSIVLEMGIAGGPDSGIGQMIRSGTYNQP